VADQRGQFLHIVVGQTLDGGGVEHRAAVGPAQVQLTAEHLAVERQRIAQRPLQVDLGAAGLAGRHEQSIAGSIEAAVELAKIVEGQARHRQGLQGGTRRLITEVRECAEADAFVGDRPQLFLDLLERRAEFGGRCQACREYAGEPAHCASQIDVFEQVFATMALKQYQRIVVPGPAHQHPRQRGQQQVVDLGAIGRRSFLQQLAGQGLIEFAAQGQRLIVLLPTVRMVVRQSRRSAVQLLLPEAQFGL